MKTNTKQNPATQYRKFRTVTYTKENRENWECAVYREWYKMASWCQYELGIQNGKFDTQYFAVRDILDELHGYARHPEHEFPYSAIDAILRLRKAAILLVKLCGKIDDPEVNYPKTAKGAYHCRGENAYGYCTDFNRMVSLYCQMPTDDYPLDLLASREEEITRKIV